MFELLGLDVAIAGDLLEERARGRSTIWYWRQVLIAIWIGIWGAIRNHKALALRAVATGCAVNSVGLFLWLKFLHFGLPLMPMISLESIASLLIILLTQAATGWIVARTHRAQAIPMVFVFATWLVLGYLGNGFSEFSEAKRLLVDSIDQSRFRLYLAGYLAWHLIPISIVVAGLLLGGIVGARPKSQPSPLANPETA
jgi:hypothetical protein